MALEDLSDRIIQEMRKAGAARSAELQQLCEASQASVSRALTPLLHSGQLLRVGRGRAQTYVMPRAVEGIGSDVLVPIMTVDGLGKARTFGMLVPLVGGRSWVDEEVGPSAMHGGLPWFLADMRPQGFIGRAFSHAHPELRLAPNPDHWSEDDVLKALCVAGEDLPGNLIVGAQSFARYQALKVNPVTEKDYPALAEAAIHGGLPGSSAGGEQPKFCAVRAGKHVIVKFTPAGDSPADERWRDLLVCEHLALQALNEFGLPAANSSIFMDAGRVFLEVVRFDRTTQGRIGMVSLMAYDSEYVGKIDNWADTAARMAARDLLVEEDADRLRFLEAFGVLIGNSDRHYGNISLLLEDDDWRLAPAYDVLPMIYAPIAGELPQRDFNPGAALPAAQTLRQWDDARTLARRYWEAVASDERISQAFRAIAGRHAQAMSEAEPLHAREQDVQPPLQYERPS